MQNWDWDSILSSVIQLVAAILIYRAARAETKKKGTKRQRRPRKRK